MNEKKQIKILLKSLPSTQAFKEIVAEHLLNTYNVLFKETREIIAIIDDEKWELYYENYSSAILQVVHNDKTLYLKIEKFSNRIRFIL
jgi:hypothetical protein